MQNNVHPSTSTIPRDIWRHKFRTPKKLRRLRKKQEALAAKDLREIVVEQNHKQNKHQPIKDPDRNGMSNGENRNENVDIDVKDVKLLRKKSSPNYARFKDDGSINKRQSENGKFISPIPVKGKKKSKKKSKQKSLKNLNIIGSSPRCNEIEPIKYGVMRSIVTALSYIEQNGGFENKDLYLLSKRNIEIDAIAQKNFQQQVRKYIDLMLGGEAQQTEVFDLNNSSLASTATLRYGNITLVAMALLGVLQCSEPLLPESMYTQFLNVNEGNEIEELLSSPHLPDLNSMTLIILLHHLAKLYKVRMSDQMEGEGLAYMKKVAGLFGNIILRKSSASSAHRNKCSISIATRKGGSFFSKREKVEGDIARKEDVMMLIISHMSNDNSVVVNSPRTKATSNVLPEEKEQVHVHDSLTKEKTSQNQHSTHAPMELDQDQVKGSDTQRKGDRHEVKVCPQDEVGVKNNASKILYYDNDDTMTRARKRLESAEMLLERIENRSSLSDSSP